LSSYFSYPQEIVPIMDLVVHQEYTNLFGQDSLVTARIQVRTFNLKDVKTMRDLNPQVSFFKNDCFRLYHQNIYY